MKAMILAAGYGTRFRPATYEIPKPMVPVCNRPLISYAVESLLGAGVREIVVNLHHLPDVLENYLRATYSGRCTFHFSFEPEILGTGGGIRKVRPVLEQDEAFYLVNGDTIQSPPFAKLAEALKSTSAVAALSLRRPPRDDRFTPVMFENGFVTGFGKGPGEPLMFAGAHAVSRRIFEFLPDKDFSGLTEDVYGPLTERSGRSIAGVVYEGLWFDIGTPRRYLTASRDMLELIASGRLQAADGSRLIGDSLIGPQSESETDLGASVLGARSKIAERARVANSILWNGVSVGADAHITDSVIGHNVTLPHGSRVENALVCRRLPEVQYAAPAEFFGSLVAVPIDPDRRLVLRLNGS